MYLLVQDLDLVYIYLLYLLSTAYYKSAADRELSAHRNQSDWDLIRLRPRVLRNVSRPKIETETKICGFSSKMPVFIAPAALGRLAHPDGEKLLVRAAARHGIIYMVTSTSISEINLTLSMSLELLRMF